MLTNRQKLFGTLAKVFSRALVAAEATLNPDLDRIATAARPASHLIRNVSRLGLNETVTDGQGGRQIAAGRFSDRLNDPDVHQAIGFELVRKGRRHHPIG